MSIDKSNSLEIERVIHSNGKIVSEDLLDNLESMDNIADLQLLLSVIASYYINWEELPRWRTSEFTVKFVNRLVKDGKINLNFDGSKWYGNHLAYIRRHLNIYYETRNNWKLLEKWQKTIKEMILNVWTKLNKFKWFRKSMVSHWQWARLSDQEYKRAIREWDDKILHENANFVFPPSDYIKPLIEKLSLKLKEDIWTYKKAAYIWSYTFLTHPFSDGNSRTSRIMMMSYLDEKWKNFIKLYTFLATFLNDLPSYDDFLSDEIYPLFDEIKNQIKIKTKRLENFRIDTVITEYPSIDKYEKIIDQAASKLEKRIITISKYIYENIESINVLLKMITLTSNLHRERKVLANLFLKNLFDFLKENSLKALTQENIWEILNYIPDSFYKENRVEQEDINSVRNLFLQVLG